jgi:carbon monoxide dehydrogenase subunit G
MARYTATVDSPRPPEEVFRYLVDFTTAAEWDPGTVSSVRLDDGPLAQGSEFEVVASFLGRESTLRYRIVTFEPSSAVTLRGENKSVVSLDTITIEPSGAGSRVTYDANLTLKGLAKVIDPVFAVALRRLGDNALAGMRAALS